MSEIFVTGCHDCPFMRDLSQHNEEVEIDDQECAVNDAQIQGYEVYKDAPTWCPLREAVVTVAIQPRSGS